MFICITNVDKKTGVPCTEEPMSNGPAIPSVKGFEFDWANESIYPVDCDHTGRYTETPQYYGTCDDDADTSTAGVLEVLTEVEFTQRKRAEFYARKPFASWVFDESTLEWNPPVLMPDDGKPYEWSEAATLWVAIDAGFLKNP